MAEDLRVVDRLVAVGVVVVIHREEEEDTLADQMLGQDPKQWG